MSGALEGLRVVELSHERVAFAGKLMADTGADVVAVEPPSGQVMRGYEPFYRDAPDPEGSLYWWHYNTSKRGVTLDLDHPRGPELLRRLVADADVLLEGEDPGRLARLGVDYTDLYALNPNLVMVSVTPFGRSGPRSDEPATDLTILASGGPVWMNGYDDHSLPPVRGAGNQAYQTAAHYAVLAALVALLARDEIGRGQHVDVNAFAAANVTTEGGSYTYLVAGDVMQRQTGRHASAGFTPPMQALCADGVYANTGVGLRGPRDYAALLEWLEADGLVDAFPKSEGLREAAARDSIDAMLAREDPELQELLATGREALAFLASRLSAYDFFVGTQERGIPTGVVYSPEEALEDPHHVARGLQVEVEHEDLGERFTYPGAPYRLHGSPWQIARRAPHIGEHNSEVFGRWLGLSDTELAELRTAGVV